MISINENENTCNYKLIDENGEVVGTLDEVLEWYNRIVMSELKSMFDEEMKKRFTVSKDQECQAPYQHFSKGCNTCFRNEYCSSFEKDL